MDTLEELNHLLLDHMRLEVTRPVRREPAWATAFAQLYRAFEMTQFDAEACRRPAPRRRKHGDRTRREYRLRLGRVVDAVGVGALLVVASDMSRASFGLGAASENAHLVVAAVSRKEGAAESDQ